MIFILASSEKWGIIKLIKSQSYFFSLTFPHNYQYTKSL